MTPDTNTVLAELYRQAKTHAARMDELRAEQERVRAECRQHEKSMRSLMLEICDIVGLNRNKKADTSIRKAGFNSITAGFKAKKTCHVARKDALNRMKIVADRKGYRFVPPEIMAEFEERLTKWYKRAYTLPNR